MTQRRIEWVVYLIGAFVLGATENLVRTAIGDGWLVLAVVVVYLLALRLLGASLARKWGTPESRSDEGHLA